MTLLLSRYWSITSPLRYLRRRTKKRALVMIILLITRRGWCLRTGERVAAIFYGFIHHSILFLVFTSIMNFFFAISLQTPLARHDYKIWMEY